jgi:hypothetical protein
VSNADVSDVVITVSAPRQLPRIRGRIAGLPNARPTSTKVQLTGPIVGSLETSVGPDGSFEFPDVIPGLYNLKVSEIPGFAPVNVVVTWNDADVQLAAPVR